jgi:hypothetical protein
MDPHQPASPPIEPASDPDATSAPPFAGTTGVEAQTEATSYWAAAPPEASPRSRRLLLAIIWIAALLLAAFYAVLIYGTSDGSDAYRFGRATGALVGPFLLALILRFVWVRLITRRRAGPRPILRSPWIPFGAVILVGLNLLANASTLVPRTPAQVVDAIRIDGPYSLRPASPETADIAAAGLKGNAGIRSYEVREVVGEDGSLSLLVVADGALSEHDGAIESLARGMESTSGLTATIEVIRERRVAIAVGETLSIGAWIDEPFGFFVYSVTPTNLHRIIEEILDARAAG